VNKILKVLLWAVPIGAALIAAAAYIYMRMLIQMPKVDADGTVHLPSVPIPYSQFASDAARKNFIDMLAHSTMPDFRASIEEQRENYRKSIKPALDRLQNTFAVTIQAQTLAGVQTDIIEPQEGVPPQHQDKVLMNLHGGGFTVGARDGGQLESIPIAALGGFKVVAVDYRMAPEHKFPAASEDVVAVYRELLKTYRPENIGIYGCSAGGMLVAQSLAWLQQHELPVPGAAGIFGAGAQLGGSGDSNYVAAPLMGWPMPPIPAGIDISKVFPYFAGADVNDPLVSPGIFPERLRAFPPTLVISSTRDLALSSSVHLHAQLRDVGVESDLHVWEAMPHCFFAAANADPQVPEMQQAWKTIANFFNRQLGAR
jgi:acetyl esterase/lipase